MREDSRSSAEKLIRESRKSSFERRSAPSCSLCSFLRPEFRYRKCLFAKCPYGKDNKVFRGRPSKKELTIPPAHTAGKAKSGQEGGRHV